MRVICAWCGVDISKSNVFDFTVALGSVESTPVSHGICPRCFDKVTSEARGQAEAERFSVVSQQESAVVI